MLLAAKEKLFSTCSDPCVLFPLAAFEGVGENSRLGSERPNHTRHQEKSEANSKTALGIPEVLLESRGGCRGSGNTSGGFTIGIRAPGQSYKQCLAQNAHTYSAGGALELAANVATGTNTDYSSNRAVDFVTGNSINSVLFGSATDAGLSGVGQAPGLIDAGMGAVTTYGRRTGTGLAALNLAGNGGVPKALSEAGGRLATKSFFSTVGKALNLGLSTATRLGIDIGLTGAELIGCAFPQS